MSSKILPSSYLTGVLLWVNAIKDAYLWVDSPDCFFMKCDNIQWNHDLNSELRNPNWEHKILSTISDANNVIDNRNSSFVKTLSYMASKDYTNLIFVSSMPMSQLVWVDYDWLINIVSVDYPKKSIFNIPSRSMTDCWLDWYSDLLFSLAKNIDITWANPIKNKIAIIWNLFDRNEWDCRWNVSELKKIFTWLWLDIVSIWLDWWNYEDILNVKKASMIISLPYWRKAAKKIAKRLGVDILELDLPFWLTQTIDFIKEIWIKFDIDEDIIEKFVIKETSINNDVWIVKHIINSDLVWKKISYYWDPYMLLWIIDICNTYWIDIKQILIHWANKHIRNNLADINSKNFNKIIFTPSSEDVIDDIDLFISIRNKAINIDEEKMLIIWFPSYYYHVFTNTPYFWIKGSLNFINRVYNKFILQ